MTLLIWLTIVAVTIVVAVVASYLIATIVALTRANRDLGRLAGGLEAIEVNTRPLAGHLSTINGAAGQLLAGLKQVDENLKGIAVMLRM
ncbi:MAG: hypothetical protein ACT4P5_20405 [Armatimonadota bacterium]